MLGDRWFDNVCEFKKNTTSFNVGAGLKLLGHLQVGANYNFALKDNGKIHSGDPDDFNYYRFQAEHMADFSCLSILKTHIENHKKTSFQVTLDIHLKGGFLFVLYKPFIRYRKDTPLPIPRRRASICCMMRSVSACGM